jgi:hypothetical protein
MTREEFVAKMMECGWSREFAEDVATLPPGVRLQPEDEEKLYEIDFPLYEDGPHVY